MSLKRALHLTALAALTIPTFTSSEASAQSKGFALDRFDPSERGSEWFALESLDLRGHVRPALGVVLDWSHRPLATYKANGDVDQTLVEDQVFLHAGGSLVLWNRLRLALNIPIAIHQQGDQTTFVDQNGVATVFSAPDTPAFGDIRLGADVRLLGEYGDVFTLAAGAQLFLPTGSRANFTGDETVRIQPRVVGAGDVGPIAYSARVAVQVRPDDRKIGANELGSEILFAGAVGVRAVDKHLVIGPEIYGSTQFNQAFDKLSSPLEGIFGFHYTAGDVRFGLGGGLGLTRGYGSPTSRVLASFEWAPQIEKEKVEEDRDKDGILDKDDACIDVPGIKTDDPKTNGCPPPQEELDRDKDGILDKDDACPDVPGVKTDDPKTNGCPPDRDKDGILDKDDACPDVPGIKTSDPKTNGCPPDPDRDHDGIPNDNDACPDEPGKPNPDPKKNGCPMAFIKDGQIRILEQVKFATASAAIVKGKDSEDVLNAVLKVLTDHPEIKKIRVEGHTDNRGAAEMNKKLSAARAASVVTWLTQHQIAAGRLTSQGFGPDSPIDTNTTDMGRQNNRRVEFHIESEDKKAP